MVKILPFHRKEMFVVKAVFAALFVLISLCFEYQACEATEAEEAAHKLLSTTEGTVLFLGWEGGYGANYDVSRLTDKQTEDYKNNGLNIIAERFEDADSYETARIFSEILAKWHIIKNNTKKSLYWSFRAAENGSSFCMGFLSCSYQTGRGLIQDLEECIKWAYLAAAAGDEHCKNWVNAHGTDGLFNEKMAPIFKEAQKRAKNWMESHKELFFSPN